MERRPATLQEARALASPLRLRILRLCFDAALTNQELAEQLGRDPATVLHHVRTLVDNGFLVAEEVRRGRRGSRERPYRTTGKSWWLDGAGLVPEVAAASVEAFVEEVRGAPEGAGLATSRLALRLPAADRAELQRRFDALLSEYAERGAHPDGEPFAVFLALYDRSDDRPGTSYPPA